MITTVEPSRSISSAADSIAELARIHAAEADKERRLRPEVTSALREGGFLRHFVPSSFGGAEGGFTELLAAVAVLGRSCPSTAWMGSLLAHGGRMVIHLPQAGQEALWGNGPDTYIASGLVPGGELRSVRGGWRVSGQWAYVSGADIADWALLSSLEKGEDRNPWCFVVPRNDFTVIDTWHNLGMRATCSNTVVLDDAFVPTGRSFERAKLEAGLQSDAPPCYRAPLKAVNGLSFAGPVLGAAQGMLERWVDWINSKGTGPDGRKPAERETIQNHLARSAAEIATAALVLQDIAQRADEGKAGADSIESNMRDWSFATDLMRAASERVFLGAGTTAHHETHELQRLWRDVQTASSHFALQFDNAARLYAARQFAERLTTPETL